MLSPFEYGKNDLFLISLSKDCSNGFWVNINMLFFIFATEHLRTNQHHLKWPMYPFYDFTSTIKFVLNMILLSIHYGKLDE